jgi:Fic family protein
MAIFTAVVAVNMGPYIYESEDWPTFRWSQERLADRLGAVRHRQGRLIGRMETLGFNLRAEANLEILTEEVIKSSEIEGEILDKDQVRSSIARRLGMDIDALTPAERNVEGAVEMMLDATQKFAATLTAERLYAWHSALFSTGHSGMVKIITGAWRNDKTGPMQVVSGPMGKEWVHYEAPPAERLSSDMNAFLEWFNTDEPTDLVLKAGVAHLWYVTIHPFEDGNGRIARAIADLTLARSENSAQRFYSMSAQIREERKAYYDVLETTQKGTLDITAWLEWFLDCLNRAFDSAETILANVMKKARFWDFHREQAFNDRQRLVISRLLDGFHGKLTNSKWAVLTKTSPDTALRDITGLVDRGILVRDSGGGRSTSYFLAEPPAYILRAIATYTRAHSDKFVRNGPAMFSAEMTAARSREIEGIAAQIETLAGQVPAGSVTYLPFENLLRQLHALGFFPPDGQVAALAEVLAK